jgi:site-specific recombinase XerD
MTINVPTLPDKVERDFDVPAMPGVNWQTLTDTFLSDYRGATQRSYRDAFNQFATFCGVDFQSIVSGVPDEDAVKAFRDSLLDTGHSPHTINAYLAAIRAFYRFLHDYVRKALRTGQMSASRAGELQLLIEGVLAVRKVRASNAPGRLPTTVDQSRELIASIPTDTPADLRDRAMIALIIGCGLRRIEVARAIRSDLIHRSGQLLLRIQQKGHHAKDAFVVIWPDVERVLRPWLSSHPFRQPDSPLFPSLSKRDMGNSPGHPAGTPRRPTCSRALPGNHNRTLCPPIQPPCRTPGKSCQRPGFRKAGPRRLKALISLQKPRNPRLEKAGFLFSLNLPGISLDSSVKDPDIFASRPLGYRGCKSPNMGLICSENARYSATLPRLEIPRAES